MKKKYTLFFFYILIFLLFSSKSYSIGEQFRSITSGFWNDTTTWEMSTNNGITWVNATSTPNSASGVITVRIPNLITVIANLSVDQLYINFGSSISIDSFVVLTINDGVSSDLNLNRGGKIIGPGEVVTRPNSIIVNDGIIDVDFNFGNNSILQGTGSWLSEFNILPNATLSLQSNHQINSVSIQTGAKFQIGNRTLFISGGGSVPITNFGGIFDADSGTVEYNGSSNQQITTLSYNNLTISGSGNKSMTGSFTVSDSLKLSSGTFQIGTNTLTINGIISQINGTISGGIASSLVIGGNGAAIGLPSIVLNNLKLNRANGINLTGMVTVSGNLTLLSGRINLLNNPLTLGSSATIIRQNGSLSDYPNFGSIVNINYIGSNPIFTSFELPYSGTIIRNVTILNTGGVTLSAFSTIDTLFLSNGALNIDTTTLKINGSIIQDSGTLVGGNSSNLFVSGSGDGLLLPSVSLNNLTLKRGGPGVILTGQLTVNGVLSLQSGQLNIANNNLILDTQATMPEIHTATNMIVSASTGTVRKMFTGSGARVFLFPVGDNDSIAEYSPITLNFTSGTYGTGAYAAVNLKNTKHPNNLSSTNYINRYWTVSQNAVTSFSCQFSGNYTDADIVGNDTSMWTGGWNGSNWTLLAQVNASTNALKGTVSSFSDFTGGRRSEMGGGYNTFLSTGNYSDTTKWSYGKSPLAGEDALISANCDVDIQVLNLASIKINPGIVLNMKVFSLPAIPIIVNNGIIKTQNSGTTPLPSGITYTGTIEYFANSNQTVVNSTYTNLTISGTGNKNMNGSFSVLNSLSIFGGSFVIGANTLTLNDSLRITGGNLTSGITSNLTVGGSGSEILLPKLLLNNLTLNRTNGLKLTDTLTINGTMTLTTGDVSLNGQIIKLGSSATLSETAGNTVKGNTGYIVTTRNLNNISALNVGGLGAIITTSQNMGTTEIRRGHTPQRISGNYGIRRYYDIHPFNDSLLNATLIFNYDDSELNNLSENSLSLFQSESSPCFTYINKNGVRDIVNNNITLTGISSFSRWTAAVDIGLQQNENHNDDTPNKYHISQNYPNPFNSETKISYLIPENGIVKISFYDLSGREIEVVVNEIMQPAGYYKINFDGSNYASGIYFYKIIVKGSSNNYNQTRKMIIIK